MSAVNYYVTRQCATGLQYRCCLGPNKWSWTENKSFAYSFQSKYTAERAAKRIPWPCEVVKEDAP